MQPADFFEPSSAASIGPLEGIRVVGVTKVWSGPLATCVLADLGADVIDVELPDGRDGMVPPNIPGSRLSWFRESVHRNKRSIGLDLRATRDRDTFLRLVATADVVVENYKPGTLDAWGVGYAECRKAKSDVIFVSVSGWGQYGPNTAMAAYDPVIQAASGWMSLNGEPDGEPVRAPTFLADEVAGLHAAIGALAALAHRARSGEGQRIDVSMMDTMLFSSSGLPTLAASGSPPARAGNETNFAVPCNVYACNDGHVYLAIALNKHWRRLAELMGRGELGRAAGYRSTEERLANRDTINHLVGQWCAARSTAECVGLLSAAGLVVAAVRSLAQAVADPHVSARGMLTNVRLSDGSVAPLVSPPVKFSRTPTRVRHPAPVPGADTHEVLAELDGPAG
ncbi:CoA transferase [Micromonospora sediminicola]|uniref:CaiB/BaiF CoA transferase family protein n=1 Tax=Micromonospora sediminicola TaxID=946078 RepID=UPI00340A1CC8